MNDALRADNEKTKSIDEHKTGTQSDLVLQNQCLSILIKLSLIIIL